MGVSVGKRQRHWMRMTMGIVAFLNSESPAHLGELFELLHRAAVAALKCAFSPGYAPEYGDS
jgi:hypothetical protein